ncbi:MULTISPECIES: hypothetical protein [unclassified Rhizobium]|uniref:hypothetical protein n=1 Tax=unclassified Rhizobium TaxID=2613769 RepID=UPI002478DB66|nr:MULTISPECIES: hypothetical protein [unclassified Rhizobium]MDH7804695.1 hypothetical protein [Rhizobium sp. AN70]
MRFIQAFPIVLISLLSDQASAQITLDEKARALSIIADYADRICVPKGQRTSAEIRAELTAEMNSLLRGLIDIKPAFSANYKADSYIGIIQEKIEGLALKPADCKKEAAAVIKADIF